MVDCIGTVCLEGVVGNLGWFIWLSSEGFLDFILDHCRERIELVGLGLASAGSGVVVLSSAFTACLPEGRAFSFSCVTIVVFMGWSCRVSALGWIWSMIRLGVRVRP